MVPVLEHGTKKANNTRGYRITRYGVLFFLSILSSFYFFATIVKKSNNNNKKTWPQVNNKKGREFYSS